MMHQTDTSKDDTSRSAPRPWLAILLSILAPGLGHLYSGFVRQAIVVVGAWFAMVVLAVWIYIGPFSGPASMWLATLILVSAYLLVMVHAGTVARSGAPLPVNRWLRIGLYVAYFVVFSEVWSSGTEWVRADFSEPFRAPSASMYPTLQIGDHFFADKNPYAVTEPKRGDVIVFDLARNSSGRFPADTRPDLPRDRFVMRVVGIPGDRIQVSSDGVRLNGKPLAVASIGSVADHGRTLDIYTETLDSTAHSIARDPTIRGPATAEIVVPEGRYFTMGDNRDHSNDSRYWGTVERDDIVARVSHIYFSVDPESNEVAWRRIGMSVK